MTDLEMTKLCAAAMDITLYSFGADEYKTLWTEQKEQYDPLHDDAQAMALVKKFKLLTDTYDNGRWIVTSSCWTPPCFEGVSDHLNRAICECVAKLQQARTKP